MNTDTSPLEALLTCQEMVELIVSYKDGVLDPDDRLRFEAHLAACESCRLYIDQIAVTIHALGALPAEAMSTEGTQVLLELFRDWKRLSTLPS